MNEDRTFDIADHLPHDAEHALSVGRLAGRLGLKPREITRSIELARRAGKPICSNGRGFWLADSADEVLTCADDLNRRIKSQRRTERALRRTGLRMKEDGGTGVQIRIEQLHIDSVQIGGCE